MGALTNWEAPIYLQLAAEYETTLDILNIGMAVALLLLGVGNVFTTPLSNSKIFGLSSMNSADISVELGRRFIYCTSLLIVLCSQIWMGLSRNIGDYQGAHVLIGLGAAPFEALVAISIADVWFSHERGSKLGAYVFGLAFGSFIGPLCAGFMALNQGWRWLYWWGAILSGALGLLFFLTFEETRFIRDHEDVEHQTHIEEIRHPDLEASPWQEDSKSRDKPTQVDGSSMDRHASPELKVGEVFDAVGFRVQLAVFKLYPDPWKEIVSQFWRPLKVSVIPAVFWVSHLLNKSRSQ